MSVIKRRSLQEKDELERLLESTRRYYEAYSVEYVKFYDDGFRSEGAFFNHEYREGYDKIAELLRNLAKPQELVIDVGCGVGFWSALMAEYGACVVSLDQLSGLLQKCGERSERLKLESKILRILADGFYLPFRGGTFDGATLNWVLAHIPVKSNKAFLREVGRVLKGNGWLLISDSYWRGQEGGKEQVQVRNTSEGMYEVYKYYYSPEELRSLLENMFGNVTHLETTHYEMICVARKYED